MYGVNKITSNNVVDFAAEELKKYLRMMMPEGGDVKIAYAPGAREGFRLGLMQDFGLDVSDAEDTELDDILYIDCDEEGGVIAGDNPRSVLLAVYEYLKQNGCRWLLPGVDGEYIPMQDIRPVKYRHKPSCRYRGWCSEGAQFQQGILEAIEFAPKLGLNVYELQYIVPKSFYRRYYVHRKNEENRGMEPISEQQVLQWKRQCEAEIAKRGLQLHDVGHGFTYIPFGFDLLVQSTEGEPESNLTPEQRNYLAQMDGVRKFHNGKPIYTNLCMSNLQARNVVSDFVVDYVTKHSNVDHLDVWLADGTNNHCECEECRKKTPSDWYVILLNEIDEKLTKAKLNTRIVFAAYCDTTWAPVEERINNPDRFVLLFAPIFRSYAYSLPKDREKTKIVPYCRNQNDFPASLGASLDYFNEWKKVWKGSNVAFEYHFWRHQYYDLSGLMQARIINNDVKIYQKNSINGIIACGTQRTCFPNGFPFYTYARTLFDTTLSYEEIQEDYFSHLYGEDWRLFRDYLTRIFEALPFDFFSRDEAERRDNVHFDLERAKKIEGIRDITKEGRGLIQDHQKPDMRVRSVALKLLEYHADFCDLISDWMAAKARGEIDCAKELLEKARIEIGKFETEVERYFDLDLCFAEYAVTQNTLSATGENVVAVD